MNIIIPTCKTADQIQPLVDEVRATATGGWILIIQSEKAIVSVNRNKGLDKATANLVIMIDDDVYDLPIGWNEALVKPLEHKEIDIVSARIINSDGTDFIDKYNVFKLHYRKVPFSSIYFDYVPTTCCAFRNTTNRFDETLTGAEDVDFCRKHYKRFLVRNDLVIKHRHEDKTDSFKRDIMDLMSDRWGFDNNSAKQIKKENSMENETIDYSRYESGDPYTLFCKLPEDIKLYKTTFELYPDQFIENGLNEELVDILMSRLFIGTIWDALVLIRYAFNIPKNGKILEIGSGFGGSLVAMFISSLKKEPTFTSIDPFFDLEGNPNANAFYSKFKEAIESFKIPINHIAAPSSEVVDMIQDGSQDIVYIDGDHSYEAVMQDLNNYFPKVKQGGHLLGHDYNMDIISVKQAVDTFCVENKLELSIPLEGSTIFALNKV